MVQKVKPNTGKMDRVQIENPFQTFPKQFGWAKHYTDASKILWTNKRTRQK